MKEDIDYIQTYGMDNITCPYCKYKFDSDTRTISEDGDEADMQCLNCDKYFHMAVRIQVTYNTKGLCKKNRIPHNWKEFDYGNSKHTGRIKGKTCTACDTTEFEK